MKKQLFSLAFVAFFAVSSFAQLQPKSVVLGLSTGSNNLFLLSDGFGSAANSFGINVYSNDGDHVTVVNLTPNIGYAVSKNIVVGAGVGILYAKQDDFTYSNSSFNPFVLGYFPVGMGKTQLLTKLSGGIGKTKDNSFGTSDDYTTRQIGLGAGLAWFLNPSVSFDFLLGYGSSNANYGDGFIKSDGVSQFGLNVGLSVYLHGGGEN